MKLNELFEIYEQKENYQMFILALEYTSDLMKNMFELPYWFYMQDVKFTLPIIRKLFDEMQYEKINLKADKFFLGKLFNMDFDKDLKITSQEKINLGNSIFNLLSIIGGNEENNIVKITHKKKELKLWTLKERFNFIENIDFIVNNLYVSKKIWNREFKKYKEYNELDIINIDKLTKKVLEDNEGFISQIFNLIKKDSEIYKAGLDQKIIKNYKFIYCIELVKEAEHCYEQYLKYKLAEKLYSNLPTASEKNKKIKI